VLSVLTSSSAAAGARAILPLIVLISPPPEKSGPRGFFGRPRLRSARDARRLSTPPPPAGEQTPCGSYKRQFLPGYQAAETKSTVLLPRAERAGAVVTGVSSHHNEAIRRCTI